MNVKPVPIKITLTPFEEQLSRRLTDLRHDKDGRLSKGHGSTSTSRNEDEIGSPCEVGFIPGMGLIKSRHTYPFLFVNNFKDPDFGRRIQVRGVPYGKAAELAFRVNTPDPNKRDNPNHIFVLCQSGFYMGSTKVTIHGWMYGEEMQRPEWFKTLDPKRPANYFVPKDFLRCCSTLPLEEFDSVQYPSAVSSSPTPDEFIKVLPLRGW